MIQGDEKSTLDTKKSSFCKKCTFTLNDIVNIIYWLVLFRVLKIRNWLNWQMAYHFWKFRLKTYIHFPCSPHSIRSFWKDFFLVTYGFKNPSFTLDRFSEIHANVDVIHWRTKKNLNFFERGLSCFIARGLTAVEGRHL